MRRRRPMRRSSAPSDPVDAAETDVPDTERDGRQGVRIYALVVLAFAAWVMMRSIQVGVGMMSRPGPGMWPFAAGALLCVFCVVMVFTENRSERFSRRVILPATLAVMLFAFAYTYEYIGFVIPAVAVCLFQLKVVGREGWILSILVSVLGTATTYYLFSELLGANLRLI